MTRRSIGPALLGSAFVLAVLAGSAAAGSLPDAAADDFVAMPQVAAEELAQQRGGSDVPDIDVGGIQINDATFYTPLTGDVSGNINTGAISGNALNNVSGINAVMYNTGNNVVLNSSIQLNLNLK